MATARKAHTSNADASTTDICAAHTVGGSITLTSNDAEFARELIQFAVEELRAIIEMAYQRRHVPLGMRAYVADATALLARMQVH